MIFEMRTYTLHPGALPKYFDHVRDVGRPVRGDDYGMNHGYWASEFGTLNQAWHLWSYDSLDDREAKRVALSKNPRWTGEYVPGVRPLVKRQSIRFWKAAKPFQAPKTDGGFYELRMYKTNLGQAGPWCQMFKDILPVREKYAPSPNVGLWQGEAPDPNEVAHMWHYPTLDSRGAARGDLYKDPQWQAFIARSAPMLTDLESIILLPHPAVKVK